MADLNSFAKIETNFNTDPYYDDWVKSKGFLRILFKPGTAVQARELTQLQTILGDQISQLADNSMVEGTVIRGGQIYIESGETSLARKFEIDTNSKFYAEIQTIMADQSLDWREILIGNSLVYVGQHNGEETSIKFTIVDIISPSTSSENLSLVGVYESEQEYSSEVGQNIYEIGDNFSFADNKSLDGYELNDIFQRTKEAGDSQIFISSVASCSFVKINEGVIYSKGCLVYFPESTQVISTSSTTETAKIGIQVYETIITSAEDSSLFDNAAGSTNENAPGADRFKISAELAVKKIDTSASGETESSYGLAENNDFIDFYELTRLSEGVRIDLVENNPYKDIEDMLAEKIYDLAGDFLVNNGDYGATIGEYIGDDPAKVDDHFGLYVKAGKAYIGGYEVEKNDVTYIEIPAERSFTPPEEKIKFESGNSYLNYFIAKINTNPTTGATTDVKKSLSEMQAILADGTIELKQSVVGDTDHNDDIVTTTEPHRLKTGYQITYNDQPHVTSGTYYVRRINSKKFSLHPSQDDAENNANIKAITDGTNQEGIVDVGSAKIRDFRFKNNLTDTNNTELAAVADYQDFLELYVYDVTLPKGIRLSNVNMATDGADKIFDIVRSEDGTILREPSKNSMLYRLPDKRIHSISDMSYVISASTIFSNGSTSPASTISVSAPSFGGYFIPQTITTAELSEYLDEVVVYGYDSTSVYRMTYKQLDFTATTLTITLDTALAGSANALIFFKLHKNLSSSRTKTYTEDYVESSVAVDASGVATLGKYNVISIKEVLDDNGAVVDPNLYTLKSGQTENYYNFSSIKFNTLSGITLNSVTYNYFEFGSGNEPFTVDSYSPAESRFLDKFTDAEGNIIELGDCLDFRKPKAEGIFPVANDANANFGLDYTVYYSRYDKLVLNKQGDFSLIQGQPSKTPQLPADESNALTLWNFYVQPYTYSAEEIQTTSVAKVRRRVKDIALIDEDLQAAKKKISLVEKELEAVKTAKDGDNKTRTSMATLIDDFAEPLTVDFSDPETNCTIDTFEGALKPQYSVDNYRFVADSVGSNYKSGDIISAGGKSVVWADNLFNKPPNNNNFWYSQIDEGFITGGFLYEYIIKNINSGIGYVLPVSSKTNSPTLNIYPEVEVWKDDKIVPTVAESINNNLYNAYKDLKESGSPNKELLSVTWPITTNSDVNGTPESLIQNDFGEIIYDKNIIESLAENTIVIEANGFTNNSKLTIKFGGKNDGDGFHSFPCMTFSTTSSNGYNQIDTKESSFPYVLTVNDNGGSSYDYKIVDKYISGGRYYYKVLPAELFDKNISTADKNTNRPNYYTARTITSASINSIADGGLTASVGENASLAIAESTTEIRTESNKKAVGAICILSGKYTNATQKLEVSATNQSTASKQYYSLLDSQDKIISQNRTRAVDTSSTTSLSEAEISVTQPFVVREPNGVYLDSVVIAFMNTSFASDNISIYITKKKNGAYQAAHVPGSFVTLNANGFIPAVATTTNYTGYFFNWGQTKTVPGENTFKFDSPLYLDPGDYAIGFVGGSGYQVCVLGTTNDATLKNMPRSKSYLNCRINRRSFSSASNVSTLKLANPPASPKNYSLLNLNGTFISGLTGTFGPSFKFTNGTNEFPIVANKNVENSEGSLNLDDLTRIEATMSGSSYASPLLDLQTLNLIAVKYQESDVTGLTDLDIIEMSENFTYISKTVKFARGNKANSVIGSADIYVPSSSLGVKMFVKTDSEFAIDDDLNEWIEVPVSLDDSEISKTAAFQSSNKNDTKKFTFKSEELEPYAKAKIKLIMYSYNHYAVPVLQAFNANFYLTTEKTT